MILTLSVRHVIDLDAYKRLPKDTNVSPPQYVSVQRIDPTMYGGAGARRSGVLNLHSSIHSGACIVLFSGLSFFAYQAHTAARSSFVPFRCCLLALPATIRPCMHLEH
jgi:hypothetical protein